MMATASGACSGTTFAAARSARTGASLTSALSPILGIEACPARPEALTVNRKTPFSPVHTP